jgi:N-acetyl-gamma-glutamyl-phosphate reductase
MPEIQEKVKILKGKELPINFVPHLLPLTRGMLVSVFATLKEDIDVNKVLEDAYKDCEFVRLRNKPVDVKSVAGTNFCDLFVTKNGNALFVSSAIDNLLRGASSQAVVNANIICGYEEYEGIPKIAYVP